MTSIGQSRAEPLDAPSFLGPIDQLLRHPREMLERIERGESLGEIARAALITIIVGAAVFGASIGFFRAGVQVLFAGIKLPLVILLTAALVAPALSALRAVLQGEPQLLRDFALVLCALARGTMLLAALAPVVLLAISFDIPYHSLILVVVACCLLGGLVGVTFFLRGTLGGGRRGRVLISGVVAILFLVVGSQMTWTLRPYLVRPRAQSVPFVRAMEGSLFDAVAVSVDSARGRYRSDYEFESDGVW